MGWSEPIGSSENSAGTGCGVPGRAVGRERLLRATRCLDEELSLYPRAPIGQALGPGANGVAG